MQKRFKAQIKSAVQFPELAILYNLNAVLNCFSNGSTINQACVLEELLLNMMMVIHT